MHDWSHQLLRLAAHTEQRFAEEFFKFKLRRCWLRPIQLQPYRGHGTPDRFYLKGRVLEDKGITSPTETDSIWQNILNMYRRFNTAEIPHARLQVRYGDVEFEATADHEGYFDLMIEPSTLPPAERVWHDVDLEVVEPNIEGQEPVRCVGNVLVPPPQAAFGIISDIDDTIVRTGATDPLTMARIVVLNNPYTRLPFEGVAAFYKALRKGGDGTGYNPIFYVSSSPWNLYDLLIDFMNIHGIPLGPIFLRDIGLEEDHVLKSDHLEHKLKQIHTILDTHTRLPFILIGDSGQDDPEIYREVVREYPGRISAIYIRDVSLGQRQGVVRKIIKEIGDIGVEMLLVGDTVAAAEHAATHGFIVVDELDTIRARKARDEQAPTIAEQLPDLVTASAQALKEAIQPNDAQPSTSES